MSNKKKLQSFSLYINDFKIITFVIWRIVKRTLNLLRKHKMMSKQDKKYKNCKKYFKLLRLFFYFNQFFKKIFLIS
jgi:hypothetical protein